MTPHPKEPSSPDADGHRSSPTGSLPTDQGSRHHREGRPAPKIDLVPATASQRQCHPPTLPPDHSRLPRHESALTHGPSPTPGLGSGQTDRYPPRRARRSNPTSVGSSTNLPPNWRANGVLNNDPHRCAVASVQRPDETCCPRAPDSYQT